MHTPHRDGAHGFPIMHAKTIVIDEKVGYFGSVNATYNGMTLSKEVVLQVTETGCLREAHEDFETTWLCSEELTTETVQEVVDKMQKKSTEAAERKEEERAKSAIITDWNKERAKLKAEEARLNAISKSELAKMKLAKRGNQLLGRDTTRRALGKEFSAEVESDTQGSENIAESDLHELQPFASANGGGRAAETSDDRSTDFLRSDFAVSGTAADL